MLLKHAFIAVLLLAQGAVAPKPLFRDPVHDGAADPTLIFNRAVTSGGCSTPTAAPTRRRPTRRTSPGCTARTSASPSRATAARTGATRGTANIPVDPTYTQWAPDIVFSRGSYHMFLTVVPGTFKDWNAPRSILHYTSPDLEHWTYASRVEVGSDRIIDASLFPRPHGWFSHLV